MNPDDSNPWAAIKDEIRRDAVQMRERTPHPTLPKSHPRPRPRARGEDGRREHSIAELARFPFTTFVDNAFRVVLGRPPDPVGFDAHVRMLIAGASKIEVLGNLRYSGEGRRAGVRIPGLLPRYAMVKLFRVPVIGYLAEWFVALLGLPAIVRQQRAMDTLHYARSFEIDAAVRKAAEDIGQQRDAGERLAADIAAIGRRVATMQSAWQADMAGMQAQLQNQPLILGMNHWLTGLRRSLSALEEEEAAQRAEARSLIDNVLALGGRDDTRPARLAAWSQWIGSEMPPGARAIALGGDGEWAGHLRQCGIDVHVPEARVSAVANGSIAEPKEAVEATLGRVADASVDVLTSLAVGASMRRLPAAPLLRTARRVLRPGGLLLLGFDDGRREVEDRLAGASVAAVDEGLLGAALVAAGFVDVRPLPAADGTACLVARAPQ